MKRLCSSFIFIFLATQIHAQIPTDGLVAYYPFTGNANDESGNGNNGTVYGASPTIDRFGNLESAFLFDGIDDYIESTSSPFNFGFGPFSFSAWIKVESIDFMNNRWGTIIEKNNYGPGHKSPILLFLPDSTIAFGAAGWYSTPKENIVGNRKLNFNQWYHIVGVRSANSQKLYINGELDASGTEPNLNSGNAYNLRIGRRTNWVGNEDGAFTGAIDDIRIYNKALSESEITELFLEEGGKKEYEVELAFLEKELSSSKILGKNFDQDRLYVVLTITNGGIEKVEDIEIEALLGGEQMEIDYSFNEEEPLDLNGDGKIDLIGSNKLIFLPLYSSKLDGYIEHEKLSIEISEINGDQVSINLEETVSMYYAKHGEEDRPFTFGKDQYSFNNLTLPTYGEIVSAYANPLNGTTVLFDAFSTFKGRCYGMSGTIGRYFMSPDARPYKESLPFSYGEDDVTVLERITHYHYGQLTPFFMNIFKDVDYNQEYQKLISRLKEEKPSILSIDTQSKRDGHAVLATKATIFHGDGDVIISIYENNDYEYEYVAVYNEFTSLFKYGNYSKFRVDNIPLIPDLNPYDVFANNLGTYLNQFKRKIFSTACPVFMYVENSKGAKSGYLSDGSFTNEIEGAIVSKVATGDIIGDSITIVYVPSGENYRLIANGYDNGNLRFEYYKSSEVGELEVSNAEAIDIYNGSVVTFDESVDSTILNIDSDGDGTVDEIKYLNNPTATSISVNSSDQSLLIYPNPAKDQLFIELSQNLSYSFEITNSVGQLVFRGKSRKSNNSIDISHFNKGVYYFSVKSNDYVTTRKIVKL